LGEFNMAAALGASLYGAVQFTHVQTHDAIGFAAQACFAAVD